MDVMNSLGMTDMAVVRDNKAQNRFELDVEGSVAFANYRLTPSAVIITHTETRARCAAAASPPN
jgi:phosphopantetheinyl transferase (holo-ACP synthase)